VIAGQEFRHASKCDGRIESAYRATLTNITSTIPSSITTFKNRKLNSIATATANPQNIESPPTKRLRSSSTTIPHRTNHNKHDDYQNETVFPSGGSSGSANSADLLDITENYPNQLTERHHSPSDSPTYDLEIFTTHYLVSTNICPNLSIVGGGVLGVEAPTLLLRHSEISAVDEDTSDTVANNTDADVGIHVHEPAFPYNPWNESTTGSRPILFSFNDAAYHTTTPLEKLSMMRLYRCAMDANCPRYFIDKFLRISN
jgi:hypothetical protein